MIPWEQIQLYLPKYLSPASADKVFDALKDFPNNLDSRFYTASLQDKATIFQGDGIRNLLVVSLPNQTIGPAPGMVLSNTCDLEVGNDRHFHSSVCYAPIFRLQKYAERLPLPSAPGSHSVAQHLDAIRRQRITQIFYLPIGQGLADESIVFLDRVCHCSNDSVDRATIPGRRLFTLSNYGAYIFLLKLSIHFTRLTDGADRQMS